MRNSLKEIEDLAEDKSYLGCHSDSPFMLKGNDMATKKICILGSTGSIGTQALELVNDLGIKVTGLSAQSSVNKMEEQIRRFLPAVVCMKEEKAASELRIRIKDTDTKVLSGEDGLIQLIHECDADTVLTSIVGIAGLKPTVEAIKLQKNIALANKETLVTGGKIVTALVKEYGVKLLPVDSEHSAIFQCLQDKNSAKSLDRIFLTASGGPFYGMRKDQLESVSVSDALNHPNWSMGNKITIDSATLMNKGLELIEAMWLFNLPPDKIEITVHRQSIVHSGVFFSDGALLAQLGVPDMKLPIQYALTYPFRRMPHSEPLTIEKMSTLTFDRPDDDTFKCLKAARIAASMGGLAPTYLNAANEIAVSLFLHNKIRFLDIGEIAMESINNIDNKLDYNLEDIFAADKIARQIVLEKYA